MQTIAITGGVGSGKSHVVNLLKQSKTLAGAVYVNVDHLVHDLYKEPTFQAQLVQLIGSIDRKEIANIVFNDPWRRKMLEFISGAMILDRLRSLREDAIDAEVKYFIIEVPLLFELGLQVLFNKTICVTAYDGIRINRIVARDHRSEEQAMAIIASQLPQRTKAELADRVISNNLTNDVFLASEVDKTADWIVSLK